MWNRKINFKKRICCLIRSALQDHKSYFHHWLTETINICMNIEKNMVFILTEWSDINVPGNDIIWMLIAIVLTCRTLLRIKVMQIHMRKKTVHFKIKCISKEKRTFFSTYHLFLFPWFHCWFILFEFIAPVRVDFLIVSAFVRRSASIFLYAKCNNLIINFWNSKSITKNRAKIIFMKRENKKYRKENWKCSPGKNCTCIVLCYNVLYALQYLPVRINGDAIAAQQRTT